MRRITIRYNHGALNCYGADVSGREAEWACNSHGEGIFSRRKDGTWQQHISTSEAGPFCSPADLRRYLRKSHEIRDARIVDSAGW